MVAVAMAAGLSWRQGEAFEGPHPGQGLSLDMVGSGQEVPQWV